MGELAGWSEEVGDLVEDEKDPLAHGPYLGADGMGRYGEMQGDMGRYTEI